MFYLIKEKLRKLRLRIFLLRWSSVVKTKIQNINFKFFVFINTKKNCKENYISMILLYVWVKFEVVRRMFTTKIFVFVFLFLHCKYGNFPLFYKCAVKSLKIQAINSFFWIMVQ